MFIKTQEGTLLNFDKITCCDVLENYRLGTASIKTKLDGMEFEIYHGSSTSVEDAFNTLTEGIVKGASLIDFSKVV